jgi:putative spermidine/putrescine transport system permease protein
MAATPGSRGARLAGLLWLLPVALLYAAGLLLPLAITVQRGLELGAGGWAGLMHNSLFTGAARNTALDSAEITLVAVLLAYTVAAAIWRSGPLLRTVLTAVVVATFWTTVLVKIVAFNALLRDNGVLNDALLGLGLIDHPLHMFPGRPAMVIGMIQFALPFAMFPILSVMLRLDRRLEQAAESLGAAPWRVFLHVVLPLTLPGVIAAALLVFVICTGFYVIPATLGTPHDQLLANVVALYALQLLDFKVASAVALVLVAVVGALTVLYERVERSTRQ